MVTASTGKVQPWRWMPWRRVRAAKIETAMKRAGSGGLGMVIGETWSVDVPIGLNG